MSDWAVKLLEIHSSSATDGRTTHAPLPKVRAGISGDRLTALFVGDRLFRGNICEVPSEILVDGVKYRWWVYVEKINSIVYLQSGYTEREGVRALAIWVMGR